MISIIMVKIYSQRFMKYVSATKLVLIISLSSLQLNGQYSLRTDTLKIQEVIISGKQISSEQPGFKFYDIDSEPQKLFTLITYRSAKRKHYPVY